MFGWFYKIFAANRFKSQSHLSFGLIRAFKEMILARIEEAIETTQSNYIKVNELFNKYNVLNGALEECYYNKDEFDYVTKYSDPIISPAQESRLRFLRKLYWISIFVFFIVETILFYMIAKNITGGMVTQIENLGRGYAGYATAFLFIASAMFALLSALMLDAGLRQLVHFFKAKKHYEIKFIDRSIYRTAVMKLVLGITLLVGSVTVLFLMNWARSYAIDGSNANATNHNPVLVYALIALSELAENSELLSLSAKWNKIRKQMESTHSALSELSIRFHNQYSLVINKAHSLGVDLQELMEREYDGRDEVLLEEFREELKNGKFHITNADGSNRTVISPRDAYYYNNLSTNESVLLNNHFASHERLSFIVRDVDRMVNAVTELEKKRLSKLASTKYEDMNKKTGLKDQDDETVLMVGDVPELSSTNANNITNKTTSNHSLNQSFN
jgi:hypothetical protein